MKWKHPPLIKIYEALGAIADDRVKMSGQSGEVISSSGGKHYNVSYSPEENAIMANDNGSYWQRYLGYPSIAFLLQHGAIEYDESLAQLLKGVAWKDINQKNKNDFDKSLQEILETIEEDDKNKLIEMVERINNELSKLGLSLLGNIQKPPKGY